MVATCRYGSPVITPTSGGQWSPGRQPLISRTSTTWPTRTSSVDTGWGSPWSEDRIKFYRDESPITYAMKIRTPTLIMANVQDFRVPITQSYKLFRAIRDHGVETQFIAYPGRMRSPQDPVGARDVQRRWITWVERHFGSAQVTER